MANKAVMVRTDEDYSIVCPGLPGCVSEGSIKDQAIANIRAALVNYLEVFKGMSGKDVEELPVEMHEVESVRLAGW